MKQCKTCYFWNKTKPANNRGQCLSPMQEGHTFVNYHGYTFEDEVCTRYKPKGGKMTDEQFQYLSGLVIGVTGIMGVAYFANWQTAVCIYLMIWGNNRTNN